MRITTNQAYGPHPRQRADVYAPSKASNETVIIFWHGGSWQRGDKKSYHYVGRALVRLGYTVVIPNYRLYPEVVWPVFAEDAALAVAFAKHRLKPKRLVAMGHSAGGQIAGAVAFDSTYLRAIGEAGAIDGFIGLAGGYDFDPARSLRPILETGEQSWRTTKLINQLPVPALLVHGQMDAIVRPHVSVLLAKALKEHGGRVDMLNYRFQSHFTILAPFIVGLWSAPKLRTTLARFVDSL
ncbi:alpha/beta hydrolase [Candidatus Saccharibacteria bacterium]|nr:alpha/beta hydrolase [Candidatus Saccharibacteria bacterium]